VDQTRAASTPGRCYRRLTGAELRRRCHVDAAASTAFVEGGGAANLGPRGRGRKQVVAARCRCATSSTSARHRRVDIDSFVGKGRSSVRWKSGAGGLRAPGPCGQLAGEAGDGRLLVSQGARPGVGARPADLVEAVLRLGLRRCWSRFPGPRLDPARVACATRAESGFSEPGFEGAPPEVARRSWGAR
jgi:hypothetical protein